MWTAQSDYPTAPCVIDVVSQAAEHGIFAYSWEYPEYLDAIQWWMKTRRNWNIDADWVFTSQGLGNAITFCLDLWSKPGDGVVIFTPRHHECALKIKRSGRKVAECPLVREAEMNEMLFRMSSVIEDCLPMMKHLAQAPSFPPHLHQISRMDTLA